MILRHTRKYRPASAPPFTRFGRWARGCTSSRVSRRKYIQGLMGHADVKMTEHYQGGHGDDAVVYMKVNADLKV